MHCPLPESTPQRTRRIHRIRALSYNMILCSHLNMHTHGTPSICKMLRQSVSNKLLILYPVHIAYGFAALEYMYKQTRTTQKPLFSALCFYVRSMDK